ncbi:hypothetical protein [Thermosulfurimonas sp. F29]|uniref:hypothetical protein n=1 Tax=Thermosulfurimonas sp. F29 TaxID=2867247 RepID=UPI001C83B591|nr:hypothetical protein [Thermosulfurimonas sp. F29]MBX6423399.1 hypothetical protein [Thermosulfurimonas sp. F29]
MARLLAEFKERRKLLAAAGGFTAVLIAVVLVVKAVLFPKRTPTKRAIPPMASSVRRNLSPFNPAPTESLHEAQTKEIEKLASEGVLVPPVTANGDVHPKPKPMTPSPKTSKPSPCPSFHPSVREVSRETAGRAAGDEDLLLALWDEAVRSTRLGLAVLSSPASGGKRERSANGSGTSGSSSGGIASGTERVCELSAEVDEPTVGIPGRRMPLVLRVTDPGTCAGFAANRDFLLGETTADPVLMRATGVVRELVHADGTTTKVEGWVFSMRGFPGFGWYVVRNDRKLALLKAFARAFSAGFAAARRDSTGVVCNENVCLQYQRKADNRFREGLMAGLSEFFGAAEKTSEAELRRLPPFLVEIPRRLPVRVMLRWRSGQRSPAKTVAKAAPETRAATTSSVQSQVR